MLMLNVNVIVTRHDHHCLQLPFLVGTTVNVISCYVLQSGLSADEKDTFFNKIISLVAALPDKEMLLIGGDFNGHVGEHSAGFSGVHGSNDNDVMNQDGL